MRKSKFCINLNKKTAEYEKKRRKYSSAFKAKVALNAIISNKKGSKLVGIG